MAKGTAGPRIRARKVDPATLPADTAAPGIRWYRSDVTLDLPKGQDSSISLESRISQADITAR
jgi:hypothetical protein